MKIAAVIVAAGQSSRFAGGNKLLADFSGQPLIRHAVAAAEASRTSDIVIVVAPEAGAILSACGPGRWRAVVNDAAHLGLSSSLKAGLAAVPEDCDGALILLADMPHVTADVIDGLIAAFHNSGGDKIVYPVSASGAQGHPVLWPRALFGAFSALAGDTGGKAILNAHPELLHPVHTADSAIHLDIDTRDDLQRLQQQDGQPKSRK